MLIHNHFWKCDERSTVLRRLRMSSLKQLYIAVQVMAESSGITANDWYACIDLIKYLKVLNMDLESHSRCVGVALLFEPLVVTDDLSQIHEK